MIGFDFSKDYILENERVLLRPLSLSDLDLIRHFSVNEPELWIYNPIKAHEQDHHFFEKYIENAIAARTAQKEYPFIVFDKLTKQYAGSTRYYDMQLAHQRLRLGYTWYGRDFQGTGLNKNCKYLLLQFAFESMEMERVGFRANISNDRSLAAMKSIGCVTEGILRNFAKDASGQRKDAVVLSILRSEWLHTIKSQLLAKIS